VAGLAARFTKPARQAPNAGTALSRPAWPWPWTPRYRKNPRYLRAAAQLGYFLQEAPKRLRTGPSGRFMDGFAAALERTDSPFTEQDGVERDDVVAFTQDFQRLGWEEGRNFHLEYRAAGLNEPRLRSAAADLVRLKPEVILVVSSAALRAAQANTDRIPIVFVGVTAPVGQGFVANLAHPGGNITGFTVFAYSIGSKWLELLKDVSPGLRHVAVMFDRETAPGSWLPLIKSVASVSGLEVNEAAVSNEIDGAIAALKTASNGGVIVLPSSFTMVHRQRIIDFAARYRLPAVYWG
jgi:putative ABC transport system substrate-binding protein